VVVVDVDHLGEHRLAFGVVAEVVGEQHGEGFVAHDRFGA